MAFYLLLVAVLSAFALIPLTPSHFFASSDGLYHIYRAMEVHRCLQGGVLICRWMPDQFLGYGTPLLNLYSPAVYYIIAAFHMIGLGWVNATKASMALFMIFSGIAAFGYAVDFLSRRAALLIAVVYVYVPYHLVNAYYRGDLPEFFAMGWFPAILWGFGRIVGPGTVRSRLPYIVAAAICYAGLVLTHNLSAFIYTGILVIYCVFLLIRGVVERQYRGVLGVVRPACMLLGATMLAYGLTAYLSFPAIFEKHLIQLEGLLYVSHADHFPTLQQILPNKIIHIYGIIFPESPEYAYKMGLVQVGLGGLGALAALVFYRRFSFRARGEAAISVCVFCVAFWFTRPESLWAWDNVPLLPFAQFPWRFLLLMALPTSVLAGFLVDVWAERWRRHAMTALIAFTLLTNTLGLRPIMANAVDGDIDLAESTRFELMYHLLGTTVAGEYVPMWVRDKPFISPEALAIVLGGESPAVHVPTSDASITVERIEKGSNHQHYLTSSPTPGRVVLNLAYFPGWRATLDRQPVEIEITDPEGLVAVRAPAGQHRIDLYFENTPVRTWGEVVSLSSAATAVVLLALAWRPAVGRLRKSVFAQVARRSSSPLPEGEWAFSPLSLWERAGVRATHQTWAMGLLIVGIVALLPFGVSFYAAAYQPPPLANRQLKINLGDTLLLLGYDLRDGDRLLGRADTVQPGSALELSTYWQGIAPEIERVARTRPYARLSNIDEQNWGFVTEANRASLRPDGSLFRSDMVIQIPPGLPPGVYQIDLGAFSRDGRPMPVRNMELVELLPTQGSIRVGPVQVSRGPSDLVGGLRVPSGAVWEGVARLEQLDLSIGLSDRRVVPLSADINRDGGTAQLRAGETLQLDLLWRSLVDHPGRLTLSASIEDDEGYRWANRDSEPVDRMYPTWMWSAGELVRDQLRMPIPPEMPAGRYRLRLKLLDNGRPLSVVDASGSPLGATATLLFVDLAKSSAPPRERDIAIAERRRIRINDDLEIAGLEISHDRVSPGEGVTAALIWRATRDVRRDYRMKLRIVGPGGEIWGETVSAPAGVSNPTSAWERNDMFRGRGTVRVESTASAGGGRLLVELYESGTDRPGGAAEIGSVWVNQR